MIELLFVSIDPEQKEAVVVNKTPTSKNPKFIK